jgi:glyoxylase-like metal-dependent hydrolase (beta-lactamase superfamily II)
MIPHDDVATGERIHPRVVAFACPFGGGGRIVAYYVSARRPTLIDTGIATSPGAVIGPGLRALGLRIEDIRYVLNTHGHYDHIGGNLAVRSVSGGQVLVHGEDAHFLERREDQFAGFAAARWRFAEAPDARTEIERMVLESIGGELRPDRVLADGDRIDLGDAELTAVHTPGHTGGSTAFLWEKERLLFTGDALQGYGTERSRFPLLLEPRRYLRSIGVMRSLGASALAMGHRFRLAGAVLDPVVRGADVVSLFTASERAMELLGAAAAGADQRALGEREVGRLVTQQLAPHFGFDIDDRSGIAPTLLVSLAAVLGTAE